ncbi:MAG: SDR family oxidoreductase, partial [Candidatus Thermoplasmatota archaeon]|nr:SDR family oxidoreductase [Candidatus Thermoplasmatota archaeon]
MSEKVILITGASSGIGKICAEYLTTKGHIVYGTSRHSPSPPTNTEGNSLYMIRMDIQDDVSVQQAIEHIMKKQGRIDVVINNAGYGIAGPVEETSMQRAHEQLETNLFGAVRVCRSVLPHMRMQKKGLIINVSSLGGLMGLPFQGFYSASKYALEGLTEALRLEVKAFGINVTLLEPGDIQTSFTERREKSNISKDSVYHTSFQRVMNIVEEEERSGVPPIIVARRLEKIINRAKPRQRYRVGSLSQRFVASMKGTV